MTIKFRITYEDGTTLDSHDERFNEQFDHAHALAPHNAKKWHKYELISDDGHKAGVDFTTGVFYVGDQIIHPAKQDGGQLTFIPGPQSYPVTKEWDILNGLDYFPIVGRRRFFSQDPILLGNRYEITYRFFGWKKKIEDKVYEKVMYIADEFEQICLT